MSAIVASVNGDAVSGHGRDDPLKTATCALAERIAAGPPLALRLDKQALNRAASTDLAGALEIEAFSQALAVASDDHQEGVAAFFDKRPPKFNGT